MYFISHTGKTVVASNGGLEEFFVVVEKSLTQIEEIKCEASMLHWLLGYLDIAAGWRCLNDILGLLGMHK